MIDDVITRYVLDDFTVTSAWVDVLLSGFSTDDIISGPVINCVVASCFMDDVVITKECDLVR